MQGRHLLLQDEGYLAWIPCVSGRLSLRHISTNQIHRNGVDCPSIHAVVEGKRYTACFFETNTEDFRVQGAHGNWHALVALKETKSSPSIFEGTIFWWLKEDGDRKWKLRRKVSPASELFPPLFKNILEVQNKQSKDAAPWLKEWGNMIETADNFNSRFKLEVNFKLQDDGLIWLSPAVKTHKDEKRSLPLDQDKTAVRQSFYMVKQCLHLHKHHEASDDALTTAHYIDEIEIHNPSSPGLSLVNDLKISLVDFHRMIFGKYSMLNRVSGIAAYASSLIQTLSRNKLLTDEESSSQNAYFRNIQSSITTNADSLEFESHEKVSRSENRRNITLLFLAVLSPQVLLYRDLLKKTVSSDSISYSVLAGTIPHVEFWIAAFIFYLAWPHLKFNARVKDLLMRSRLWGWILRKLWSGTSTLQYNFFSYLVIGLGLAIASLGIYYYMMQVKIF